MNRAASIPPPRAASSSRSSRTPRSGIGGTLIVLFVGIALGVGLAAAVAFYVMRTGNPYQPSVSASVREAGKDAAKSLRIDPAPIEKPRFDFYKILPGGEEPKATPRPAERATGDRATVERAVTIDKAPPPAPAKAEERVAAVPDKAVETAPRAPRSGERLWLQAGSFASEGDAENLKAQLAMAGMEASLQQATLPDKGVRYRVRLGPYDNLDEVNRVKNDLAKRGFDVTVIR
jgi:cell division protein FtsN